MRLMRKIPQHVLLAVAAVLAACSPGHADSSAQPAAGAVGQALRHPVSGLPVVPLTVSSARGRHVFQVELAQTFAEQEKGLMFRTSMGPDEGMVFIRTPPDVARFWMRNTVIPLDIIFVGTDRRIINIAANAVPYDETPLPSAGVAAAVLELNGGRAAALGIGPGDTVEW